MKIKVTKEYLNYLISELKLSNPKYGPHITKILNSNTKIVNADVSELAEKEELLDEKIIKLAKTRLELPKKILEKFKSDVENFLSQINKVNIEENIENSEENSEENFKELNVDEIADTDQIKTVLQKLINKIKNAKSAIENERRKSVAANNIANDNPIRAYFDLH